MKDIMKYMLVSLSMLTVTLAASAQNDGTTYNEKGGVSTAKRVTGPNDDGTYTITLETFATGTTSATYSATPVDIVLVLDYSRSMEGSYNGTTRIAALRNAVADFTDEIAKNDKYQTDDEGKYLTDENGNLVPRTTPLGNRIAVVTFDADVYNLLENESEAKDGGFLSVSNAANVTTIKNAVINQPTHKNTYTNLGMSTGTTLIGNSFNNTARKGCKRVLVLFTDGNPGTDGNFSTTIANQSIASAYTVKNDYASTVYVVGLVNNASGNILRMMQSISSNYPKATDMTTYGDGGNASAGFYQDATQTELSDIFKSIAQASGGSAEEIGASTQIRDEVTSSFSIPEGATADDVTVSVWDVDEDGNGWTKNTSYDMSSIKIDIDPETNKLVVSGFDYSKDDTKDANGYTTRANAGNWVGIRYKSRTETFWAGKKIVVEFNIEANPDATGGVGTATNTSDSGVYVYSSETGEYTCVNKYEIPHTTLTVTIKITKTGLRHGESATFKIQRASPKMVDGKMQYNAIGKPIADDSTWKSWSKVILTNKGTDGASVTKTLLALDPNYVYRVLEDDWSWSYETVSGTGEIQTTSTVEINPFEFENKEKTGVAKHAEAVTINHFATEAGGKASYEEYKSSKVQSF